MRWHSLTPSITSNSIGSTSPTGPTPPKTVCMTPEERWTIKPMETSRSMTFWIWGSSAPFLHYDKHENQLWHSRGSPQEVVL